MRVKIARAALVGGRERYITQSSWAMTRDDAQLAAGGNNTLTEKKSNNDSTRWKMPATATCGEWGLGPRCERESCVFSHLLLTLP